MKGAPKKKKGTAVKIIALRLQCIRLTLVATRQLTNQLTNYKLTQVLEFS